jgi:lipopolysaccharide exporter
MSESPGEIGPPHQLPLATQVVRGGMAVALTAYGLTLFGFLSNLILTRLLDPSDFGIFALGFFFFSLLNLRPKLGVDQAFAQRPATTGELSGTYAVLSIASGAASLLLALIAVPVLLALGYAQSVVWVMLALAAVGVSDSVMGIAWVQMDKALLFSRVSIVTAIMFPISYIPAFYLALHKGGYWSLVASNVTYALLLLIGLWWSFRLNLPHILRMRWAYSGILARELFRFGTMVGLATIASTVVYQFDNFLVGTVVSTATLGFYDRAYRIAQWPTLLVTTVLTRTAFYAYSQLQNDLARLTKTVTMSLWLITTLALPVALGIFVAADDLVLLLFGEKWLPSAVFVRFLVTYSILRPLLEDANQLFVAVGHPRRTTTVTFGQAAALVLAATPLTFLYGAEGTAVGVGVAFVVGLVLTYYFVRRTVPELSLSQAFLVPAVATAMALAAYFVVAGLVDLSALPLAVRVLSKSGFAALVFFSLTILLRPRLTFERATYVWRLLKNQPA